MEGFIMSVVSIFMIVGFNLNVNSQAIDSCNSSLSLSRLPFKTTSFHCELVWDAKSFILRYSQTAAKEWSFVLSAPIPSSYMAMGFSPDGQMIGSSAIVGWPLPGGLAEIKKYLLSGKDPSLVKLDQGNLQLGNLSVIFTEASRMYMAFQLIADRPSTHLLYALGPSGRIPVAPDYLLFEHADMVSTNLNYATGQSSETESPYARLRRSHGILNMLGWGIMMPIGIMAARYLKQWDPAWFYSHVIIQTLGFIFGVAGVVCGFVLNHRLKNNVNKHKGLGISILTLGCLQVMASMLRPNKEAKVRIHWNRYHHSVGRVLVIFAAANVFYGIHLGNAGNGWNVGYAVALVLLFLTSLVLEIRIWIKK